MTIPHEARERILTKVQETVQAGYYAPDFHGKHWYEIVASHRPAIFDATTTEEFEREMNTMLAALDSNMRLLGPNSKITARMQSTLAFTLWIFGPMVVALGFSRMSRLGELLSEAECCRRMYCSP